MLRLVRRTQTDVVDRTGADIAAGQSPKRRAAKPFKLSRVFYNAKIVFIPVRLIRGRNYARGGQNKNPAKKIKRGFNYTALFTPVKIALAITARQIRAGGRKELSVYGAA